MGMISDCYQLQENQRKNGPLAVKTPSPPALSIRLPCWPAVRRIRPRRSLSPSRAASPYHLPRPMPCPCTNFPPSVRSPAGQEVPQTLAAQGSPANAEKVQIPALTEGQTGRRWCRWAGSCAGHAGVSPGRSRARGSPWCFSPSCPPALLRPCTQTRSMSCCLIEQGRRAKGAISVSVAKTPVKE